MLKKSSSFCFCYTRSFYGMKNEIVTVYLKKKRWKIGL